MENDFKDFTENEEKVIRIIAWWAWVESRHKRNLTRNECYGPLSKAEFNAWWNEISGNQKTV